MRYGTRQQNKDLAEELTTFIGEVPGIEGESLASYYRAGEWEEVIISLLFFAAKARRPVPEDLLESPIIHGWTKDVGGLKEAVASIPRYGSSRDALNQESKNLAMEILEAVGPLDPENARFVEEELRAGEWAQAGTQALVDAMDNGTPVPAHLVDEAVIRWTNDMGALADWFPARIHMIDDSIAAA